MSTEYVIKVDHKKCIACYGCQVACKMERNLPVGQLFLHLQKRWEGKGSLTKCFYAPVMCQNCVDAPCIPICPEKALSKAANGLVAVDKEKCTGCDSCSNVCPFGATTISSGQKMEKCDMCAGIIDPEKEQPACVVACTSKALSLVKLESAEKKKACATLQAFVEQPLF